MAKITNKEAPPFPLGRPNADTFLAGADDIEMDGKSVKQQVSGRDTQVNGNSASIEAKVNALIGAVQTLIRNVVFHSGVPYGVPQQLLSDLALLRIGNNESTSTTSALCGTALCGSAICGNS